MSGLTCTRRRRVALLARGFLVAAIVATSMWSAAAFQRRDGLVGPTVTATMVDALQIDGDVDGKADPGDRIRYTVTIANGGTDATSVHFTSALDANTTLVAGSVVVSPLGFNDSYASVGNMTLTSAAINATCGGNPLRSVTCNDSLPNGATPSGFGATQVAANSTVVNGSNTVTTSNAGTVLLNTDGTFVYNPAAGFEGTDSFWYTLSNAAGSDNAQVSIAVGGANGMVWFVNSAGGGTGRQANPMTLAALQAINNGTGTNPAAGDTIFLFEGGHTGPLTLLANQKLLGQDATAVFPALGGPVEKPGNAYPATNPSGTTVSISSAGVGITLGAGNTLAGFTVGNSTTAITGGSVGTFLVRDVVVNTNGQALVITTNGAVASDATFTGFTSVTSTGGTNGIALTGIGGTVNLGSGALSGHSGNAFQVSGGTATINYSGTITNASALAVSIGGKSGGTVTFSGGIPVANATSTSSRGISLTSNTGATIDFTGGIALSTGTSAAFTATGGGTVSVTQNNSSIINTLTTTTGTALNVANTTIGASGLTFRSISAAGPANGIVLNTTGSSAGLTISGNGGTCNSLAATCTGGTIQNTTGHGILLTSTRTPSFGFIKISNIALSGIYGTGVTNFTLANSVIDGVNTSHTAADSNVAFNLSGGGATENNLSGVVSITNSFVNNSYQAGIDIQNYSGTISSLTIAGNSFTSSTNNTLSFGSAITVVANRNNAGANFAAITTGSISGNTITNFPNGAGVQAIAGNGAGSAPGANIGSLASPLIIQSNTIAGAGAGSSGLGTNGVAVTVGHLSDGFFDISSNNITNVRGNGIACSKFGSNSGSGTNASKCIIASNTINANNTAGSPGINTGADSGTANTNTPKLYLDIHNNSVSNTTGNGILSTIRSVDGTGVFRIQNNVVTRPTPASGTIYGIRVDAGNGGESSGSSVCLAISGNTTTGSTNGSITAPGIGLRQNHVAPISTFNIEGLTPDPATDGGPMEGYVNGLNPLSATGTFGVGGTASISLGATFHQLTCTVPAAPSGTNVGRIVSPQSTSTAQAPPHLRPATVNLIRATRPGASDRSFGSHPGGAGSRDGHAFIHMMEQITTMFVARVRAATAAVEVDLGTLPSSKTINVLFDVTVNTPPVAQYSAQGTISGANFTAVLTDDPAAGGGADPTTTPGDRFNTATAVISSQNPAYTGASITFTATVTPTQGAVTPNGTVQFKDGGGSLGSAVACVSAPGNTCTAQLTTAALSVASHNITADYLGGTSHDPSSSNTVAQVITTPPTVITSAATGVSGTAATLNGTVNPNGTATNARFEYGLTLGYGATTADQFMGSGNAVLPIGGGGITNLTCNMTYHFRATATTPVGTITGNDATFVTCLFTDDPLAAGITTVKLVHLTELRTRIDAQRVRFGLPAYSWTDPSPAAGATTILAQHILEMRAAVAGPAFIASGSSPTYTDPDLAIGTPIKAVHITELRAVLKAIE